jgi:hypothetical protein
MAETDWERLTVNALDELLCSAGKTTIGSPPEASNCMGYHLIQSGAGFAGHVLDLTNFNPIASGKGGSITICMKKYNPGDHAPCIFFANGKDVASAEGYILGLSGEEPSRLILKKGHLNSPLTENGEGTLRISDESWDPDTWLQVSLFVTVQTHGEIALRCRINDPIDVSPPIATPAAIDGMGDFVDDNGAILTSSIPLSGSFYVGHGVYFGGSQGRVGLFDYTIVGRQTSP